MTLSTLLAVAFYIPGQHLARTHRPGAGDYYKATAFIETEENSK